ncbi:hypothetical protein A1Q1_03177 [Trichosporon asahii var. asahii CBS 2479]|uniref:Uncharacterized protein n=1 Tax=Trichosporon asahii var. asahii (strain ATCC 90039 / CBS 2479 / JCM 2466 / KCTC 7840 / NBRC 103889/ NCYC 2677 / UAMH 7654) TaxID=1186058 RepID=J6EYL9_TRIAS|nr:hypothetical protein A1Q1_03177 [Trichosporon asahii var. asahii CBS 2479]EJT47942.1 hypothetical protein A1Q1_03177 [Trichosporon asahii var. asahii CBS 2479]
MDHNLLVSELQQLIVESKRRNHEVKDAGEVALEILRPGPQSREVLSANADKLLAPMTLGCKTKNAKIVGISIAALQRLVALGGVPLEHLPGVLQTLGAVSGQAVDIQLKILQTLLSMLTYCTDMHGETLGTALLLCFKLQDSRVSVVSSTAAATLRQAIMVVFDRVSVEDDPTETLTLPSDPPEEVQVTPAVKDAYYILSDLCVLTAAAPSASGLSLWTSSEKEKPVMLKLQSLQRTFGLELIESILSGYEGVVKKHPELVHLLRHSLHPLIIRLQGEKPSFPVALRICRLLYVLVRSYADQLSAEVETYLLTLIRLGAGDPDEEKPPAKKDTVAPWMHVLALEILRGICGDPALLRNIWTQYDKAGGTKLFAKLVSALGHLVNEKPALLGVGTQMHGLGVPASSSEHVNSGYLDMGIGIVASAATLGASAVSSAMSGPTAVGLGAHSGVKQRLIEQHDKAEPPAFPETYVYLLAVQSLCAIAESIFMGIGSEETRETSKGLAESAWPALLAALSYSIATDLSDQLFVEVLAALQDFTVACGTLDLSTPRDAFLQTLARCAVPPTVVSAMQTYMDSPPKASLTVESLVSGPTGPPSLSERNLACLRSLIGVTQLLAGSMGPGWHDVLETLQNANYLLNASRAPRRPNVQSPVSPSKSPSLEPTAPKPDMLQDLDAESIQGAVNELFENTRDLDDAAFTVFVTALCQLSAEVIGMGNPSAQTLPRPSAEPRRRTSGISIGSSSKSSERSFGLAKLRSVATLNVNRLVQSPPEVGWGVVTQHLVAVARHTTAPSPIRVQASDTLAEFLQLSLRTACEARVQHQIFDVLAKVVDVAPVSNTVATDYDVRSTGYETLNHILQSSGHSLEVGWPTIFDMLNYVCKRPEDAQPHKGDAALVRIAFPSLTLICTDFLSSLDADAMRQCIVCLGYFGRQTDDVNISLNAIGLLWNVSDAVQGDSKELWLYLLTELLALARDQRLEVRSSAMQTLFRCVELYGSSLSSELWDKVFAQVVFPLMEAMRGDESQVLALTSVGNIFGQFLPQIMALPDAKGVYQHLLDLLVKSWTSEPRKCGTAAVRVLERVLSVAEKGSPLLPPSWDTFVALGRALKDPHEDPYTQDNLVVLVKVASLLHAKLQWDDDKLKEFSNILRSLVTYSKSPDYRPDVDVMSPLQKDVAELVASSQLGAHLVLCDLAEFASLAYVGSGNPKLSYVALSKFAMPKIFDVFAPVSSDKSLYEDETVEAILKAFSLPIKLKYDCPPASKYGSDEPLWRTAMRTFVGVLSHVVKGLDGELSEERYDAIWGTIMDVFSGVLLADSGEEPLPDDEEFILPLLNDMRTALFARLRDPRLKPAVVERFAETLRRASLLYHYDVEASGGTTAPAVNDDGEGVRYWAFDQLVAGARREHGEHGEGSEPRNDSNDSKATATEGEEASRRVAALFAPAVLKRFDLTLRQFLDDAKLRGQMPFSRVREDELLYVLTHLVTMSMWGSTSDASGSDASDDTKAAEKADGAATPLQAAAARSPRAHLFAYYPLLLQLAFVPSAPSMWVTPPEYYRLFGKDVADDAGLSGLGADEDAPRQSMDVNGDIGPERGGRGHGRGVCARAGAARTRAHMQYL